MESVIHPRLMPRISVSAWMRADSGDRNATHSGGIGTIDTAWCAIHTASTTNTGHAIAQGIGDPHPVERPQHQPPRQQREGAHLHHRPRPPPVAPQRHRHPHEQRQQRPEERLLRIEFAPHGVRLLSVPGTCTRYTYPVHLPGTCRCRSFRRHGGSTAEARPATRKPPHPPARSFPPPRRRSWAARPPPPARSGAARGTSHPPGSRRT